MNNDNEKIAQEVQDLGKKIENFAFLSTEEILGRLEKIRKKLKIKDSLESLYHVYRDQQTILTEFVIQGMNVSNNQVANHQEEGFEVTDE
jgi:hypothetical protein